MSKKIKVFAIVMIILAAIIGAATFFGDDTPAPTNGPLATSAGGSVPGTIATGGDAAAAGSAVNEFSGLLSNINTISIDTSLFSNPAYKMLRDYPVLLGTDVVGRVNPFAPVGSDLAAGVPAATLEVQTLAPGKITSTSAEFGALVTLSDTVPVSVVFQYGPTDTFGAATTPVTVTKSGTVLSTITGLSAATSYKVQAVVVRGSVTTNANTVTFSTTSAPNAPAPLPPR